MLSAACWISCLHSLLWPNPHFFLKNRFTAASSCFKEFTSHLCQLTLHVRQQVKVLSFGLMCVKALVDVFYCENNHIGEDIFHVCNLIDQL